MFSLIIEGVLIVMAIGAGLKFYLDKTEAEGRIDNQEFLIAGAALLLLVIPMTAYFGTQMAISNQVTYNENWNGYELKANWYVTQCSEDGPCVHEYDCDPYDV